MKCALVFLLFLLIVCIVHLDMHEEPRQFSQENSERNTWLPQEKSQNRTSWLENLTRTEDILNKTPSEINEKVEENTKHVLQPPGGFLQTSFSTSARPHLSQTTIDSFLPKTRGAFFFPEPYNTKGIRITTPQDCDGKNCVLPVGYSYWKNINNHVGSDHLYIFLTLRGQGGPTLFRYNKESEEMAKIGSLFPEDSVWSSATAEGWYFSATKPHALYIWKPLDTRLYRYDILQEDFEEVLDIEKILPALKTSTYLWQIHSSDDDRVHIGTVRDRNTYESLGCFAFEEDAEKFHYFPKLEGTLDECNIDASGRWLLMLENVDSAKGMDNRIIDLQEGTQSILLDENGALAHLDMGYSYAVGADNFNHYPDALLLLRFPLQQTTRPAGELVYYGAHWGENKANHVTHQNRKRQDPQTQFACGSNVDANQEQENEIVCFSLDGTFTELVVAPVMSSLEGIHADNWYEHSPKGNLDVTGEYFIWTSNMKGNRLDAFMVKVPKQHLT